MKIFCMCQNTFDIEILEYRGPVKRACPHCHRSYELVVVIVPEAPQFWK
jgi:hypothetical protein